MNRHKLLALAAMLLVPLVACDEGTPPVPQGTIDGQVSIEGQGIDGVTVTMSSGPSTTTSGGGRFSFANVDGGTYTLTISNFPADASFTSTSQPATITTAGQTATVNFTGTYIRTASILGSVTVERAGVNGVTVRLSGMSDASTQTDANGQFAFTQLRAGSYELELSGFAADVSFSAPAQNVTLGVGETETTTFEGTYVRTAGIQGRVAVEGQGLSGVTVNLSGVGPARTTTTDAAGQYAFAELRAGVYQVGISGFSADDYEFGQTSQSVTVALGQTANVPFDGTRLRTAGISGQVAVGGQGIGGVMVALSGAASATDTTNSDGQYGFSGLAAGTYTVTISGWDEERYHFAMESRTMTVELADNQAAIASFTGAHVANATVMGYVFLDANPENDELDEGDEDTYDLAGLEVMLVGPGVTDKASALTDADGMYMFESVVAGSYSLNVTTSALDSVADELDDGVEYGGSSSYDITVEPGATITQNLPFNITVQTITMQAMMGNGKMGDAAKTGAMIKGVGIDFYPTYQAAEAERQELSSSPAMTDSTGTAKVMFPRAADTGPGGRDHVVFAKVATLPHDDLEVTANSILEVSYNPRTLTTAAARAVQVINRRVNFQFWVKNVETEIGGDEFLQGWASEVRTAVENTGFQSGKASGKNGKATFTDILATADLPMKYYVRLSGTQAGAMGESFMATPEPSDEADVHSTKTAGSYLTYEYDGVVMPGDTADLGVLRVKWTTQTLVVGVHYEATQISGFDSNIAGGDARPTPSSAGEINVKLQVRDSVGTLQDWDYPEGSKPTGGTTMPRTPKATGADHGLVVFGDLPVDQNFVVTAETTSPRKIIGLTDVDTFLGGRREGSSRGKHSSGAFGAEGGTGPTVHICPLAAKAGRSSCSTFAYGYNNGTVTGHVLPTSGDGGDFNFGSKDTLKVTIRPVLSLGARKTPRTMGIVRADSMVVDSISSTDPSDTTFHAPGWYQFKDLDGGTYEVSVASTSTWGRTDGRALGTDTVTVLSVADADGSDAMAVADTLTATYLKTSISGTVANDNGGTDFLADGDGRVTREETVAGAKMTLKRVAGSGSRKTYTTVKSTTTDNSGKFSFMDLPEGKYVVEADTTADDYILLATNTNPRHRSPEITTSVTARTTVSGSGAGSLPRWSYGASASTTPVNPDSVLRVLNTAADADFTVLFRNGEVRGSVNQRRVGASADVAFAGVTVVLVKCGDLTHTTLVTSQFTPCPRNLDTSFFYGGKLVGSVRKATDANGDYSFSDLEEGLYHVTVDLTGVNHDSGASTLVQFAEWLLRDDGLVTIPDFRVVHR